MHVRLESYILAALMRKNRILYTLLGLSLCLTMETACTGKNGNDEADSSPVRSLATATEAMNKRCPQWVDPESRLDSVTLVEMNQLHYYYTLPNKDKSGVGSNAFKAFLLPKIIENIHYNPDLKMHRDSGVVMYFIYHDRNGELITEFSVGPDRYL